MENLKQSMEHLSQTTGALAESSKKLDGVIDKADGAMSSIKKDAEDIEAVVADARKTVQAATRVFREAREGKGLLAALLSNQELANDLRALIKNLRAHGVLFYRDSAAKIEATARDQEAQRRQRGGRR
jgi:ABC-type transporter Mla subunit MlaD